MQRANLTRGTAEQEFDNLPSQQHNNDVACNAETHAHGDIEQADGTAVCPDANAQAGASARPSSKWTQYTDAAKRRNAPAVDEQFDDEDTPCEDVGDGDYGMVTVLPDQPTTRKRRKKQSGPTDNQSDHAPQERFSNSAPRESCFRTAENAFTDIGVLVDLPDSHDQTQHIESVENSGQASGDHASKVGDDWGGALGSAWGSSWNNNDAWA